MNVKVSILIPTYNQPQYIIQCVESALAQNYENIEVIVNDDSTNDETKNLLLEYSDVTKLKYYKTIDNIGRVANYRKLLFEYATGDWVVMLDGDDYYTDSNFITKAIELISKDDKIVLVGAGILIKNENNNSKYLYNLGTDTIIFDGKEVFTKYKKIPNHQTDVYNRKLAMALDFYRHPSIGADSESLYRLCLRGHVGFIGNDVAVWRVHQENSSYTRNLKDQIKEVGFIDSIYKDALNFLSKSDLESWKNVMMNYAGNHLLNIAISQRQALSVWLILIKYLKYFGAKPALGHLLRFYGIRKSNTK